MTTTLRWVQLPDNIIAIEAEEVTGSSEAQATYSYYLPKGKSLTDIGIKIDKSKYRLGYWGEIEGRTVLD